MNHFLVTRNCVCPNWPHVARKAAYYLKGGLLHPPTFGIPPHVTSTGKLLLWLKGLILLGLYIQRERGLRRLFIETSLSLALNWVTTH